MTDAFATLMKEMLERSQKMAAAFTPSATGMDMKAFESLFPTLPKEWAEAWFGKTFNPEGLDARTRLLVSTGALVLGGPQTEAQLRLTIRQALAAGATKREVAEVIWQMSMFGGLPAIQKALEIAQSVFAESEETKDDRG